MFFYQHADKRNDKFSVDYISQREFMSICEVQVLRCILASDFKLPSHSSWTVCWLSS